jgi:hypothetical protein
MANDNARAAAGFVREIDVFIKKNLSPEAQSQRIADVARRALAEEERRSGKRPHRDTVDGVEGVPYERVKPTGVIWIRFQSWGEIIPRVLALLLARSPHAAGAYVLRRKRGGKLVVVGLARAPSPNRFVYANLFRVLANGVEVEPEAYEAIPPDALVEIVNIAPYATRLEVGKAPEGVARSKFAIQYPDGTFHLALPAIRKEVGGLVMTNITYRPFQGPGVRDPEARFPVLWMRARG